MNFLRFAWVLFEDWDGHLTRYVAYITSCAKGINKAFLKDF